MLNQADLMESGPCGNFSEMYQCMCNHMGLPVREEVGWVSKSEPFLLLPSVVQA